MSAELKVLCWGAAIIAWALVAIFNPPPDMKDRTIAGGLALAFLPFFFDALDVATA